MPGGEPVTKRVKAPSIVVVEDEPELREALAVLLEAHGYDVVGTARGGREAVDVAIAKQPDFVLVDYRMPGVDGVTAAQAILEAAPTTQVVMLTAYDESSLGLDPARAGIFAFLVKGCPPALIVEALGQAWARKQSLDARRPGAQARS